jgi:hypothetical protein
MASLQSLMTLWSLLTTSDELLMTSDGWLTDWLPGWTEADAVILQTLLFDLATHDI